MKGKQHREASAAVKAWCEDQGLELIAAPRHVHPRSYVVGHAAPLCLVVAQCWADSEPQTREFDKENPLRTIHTFDDGLRAGDWCVTAYVVHGGIGEPVAVPLAGGKP
jgi:hypothetical protein